MRSHTPSFIAKHAVYYQLQGPFMKGLYVPSVEARRLGDIMGDLENVIGFLFNNGGLQWGRHR